MLRFVLGHEEGGTPMGRVPHTADDGRENMVRRGVVDVLGSVQAQAVKVKFLDPVAGIGKEELAYRARMLVCIVNGLPPVRSVAICKIFWGKLRQEITICSQVIIDHV